MHAHYVPVSVAPLCHDTACTQQLNFGLRINVPVPKCQPHEKLALAACCGARPVCATWLTPCQRAACPLAAAHHPAHTKSAVIQQIMKLRRSCASHTAMMHTWHALHPPALHHACHEACIGMNINSCPFPDPLQCNAQTCAWSRHARARSSCVLPHPDGPRTNKTSPGWRSKLTLNSNPWGSKTRFRSLTCSILLFVC